MPDSNPELSGKAGAVHAGLRSQPVGGVAQCFRGSVNVYYVGRRRDVYENFRALLLGRARTAE
jgi:hypothetical protein